MQCLGVQSRAPAAGQQVQVPPLPLPPPLERLRGKGLAGSARGYREVARMRVQVMRVQVRVSTRVSSGAALVLIFNQSPCSLTYRGSGDRVQASTQSATSSLHQNSLPEPVAPRSAVNSSLVPITHFPLHSTKLLLSMLGRPVVIKDVKTTDVKGWMNPDSENTIPDTQEAVRGVHLSARPI